MSMCKAAPLQEWMASLEPDSVDLILTDPPYRPEGIPLFGTIAAQAARVLKPKGYLVTYTGCLYLNQVMEAMDHHAPLRWYWRYSLPIVGRKSRIRSHAVVQTSKDILVWSKGWPRLNQQWTATDLPRIDTPPAQATHPHEQGVEAARYLVSKFTKAPREEKLVIDPCCGSGTFLVAAKQLGCSVRGCDIDLEWAKASSTRIDSTVPWTDEEIEAWLDQVIPSRARKKRKGK